MESQKEKKLPISIPSDFLLPFSDWRPFSNVTSKFLAKTWRRRILDDCGRAVDDPGGKNSYWAPTTELGATWRNSRVKWRWRSKLPEGRAILEANFPGGWKKESGDGAKEEEEEAEAKEKRQMATKLKTASLRSEKLVANADSFGGDSRARTSVSAAKDRRSRKEKEEGEEEEEKKMGGGERPPGLIGLSSQGRKGERDDDEFDTWVVEEEEEEEKKEEIYGGRGKRNVDGNCSRLGEEDDSPPEPPPFKKPKFGVFSSVPTAVAAAGPATTAGSNRFEPPKARQVVATGPSPLYLHNRPPATSARQGEAAARTKFGQNSAQRSTFPRQAWATAGCDADDANASPKDPSDVFRTAGEKLVEDYRKRYGCPSASSYGNSNRTLGASRPGAGFRPPIINRTAEDAGGGEGSVRRATSAAASSSTGEEVMDERLKNVDAKMVELIRQEIMDACASVHWDDIAGLEFVKGVIKEIVVFPMLRPDIFKGLKAPPKGLLLFGPPGTGKTLIGKCIASQSKSTFFSISASSLTSKWVGEGEKMVRALFAVARVHQPSVVFIDEIDSLLTARSDSEHESSRRLKTEFLVQLDGATTEGEERILVVGATNRPQDLDEAARRRLVKRLYVPLPEASARGQIIRHLLRKEGHCLSESDIESVVSRTGGYSGADMAYLCRDAALGPVRSLDYSRIETISTDEIRPVNLGDFEGALRQVKASVSDQDLRMYQDWNTRYGSGK